MSKRFRIILASACALLALLSTLGYGDQVRAQAEAARNEALERYGGEVAQVVVTTQPVVAGDELSTANCALRDWLIDFVPEGALTSLDDVAGASVASAHGKGVPLTAVDLEGKASAVSVPSGKVAVTVPVTDRTGVAADGSAQGRLAAYRCEDGATRLLCADVTVLSTQNGPGSSASLTVAVPAQDVAALVTASADGSLRLVRPADDIESLAVSAAPTEVASQDEEDQDEKAAGDAKKESAETGSEKA